MPRKFRALALSAWSVDLQFLSQFPGHLLYKGHVLYTQTLVLASYFWELFGIIILVEYAQKQFLRLFFFKHILFSHTLVCQNHLLKCRSWASESGRRLWFCIFQSSQEVPVLLFYRSHYSRTFPWTQWSVLSCALPITLSPYNLPVSSVIAFWWIWS